MNEIIIFKRDDGFISVIYPTAEAVQKYGVKAIADKDVPDGKRYKIAEASFLPPDRSQRDRWTIDDAELTDGVGQPHTSF